MSITPHNGLLAAVVGLWGLLLVFGGAVVRREMAVLGVGILVLTGAQLALAQVLPAPLDVLTVLLYLGALAAWLRSRRGPSAGSGDRRPGAHNYADGRASRNRSRNN